MKKLLKWIKPFLGLFLLICAFEIILPITYSYVPQFNKYIFDTILSDSSSTNTLPSFLLIFFDNIKNDSKSMCIFAVGLTLVIYQLFRGSMMFFSGYIRGVFSESIAMKARNDLFNHFQELSFSYYNNIDSGDFIQRCTSDIETMKSFLSQQFPDILYIIVTIISGAIQMSIINVKIMLVTLCVFPINIASSIFYLFYIKKKFEHIEEVESKMTTICEENVNGARVVKAFAQEQSEIDKFETRNSEYRDEIIKLNKILAFYWGFGDAACFLQYALTIGFCINLAENGSVSVGDIVACLSYISMLIYPIRSLGRIISNFGKSIVAAKRIDEILSVPTEYSVNGNEKPLIKGGVEFKKVGFKFEDATSTLLKDVSFKIEPGETVAIVGKTGCGKSTIANILTRLLEYDNGSVLIDGFELKTIDKKWIRDNVGLILQDPFLYTKNVYDNISITNSNVTKDQVLKVSQMAQVHDDILTFDKKYETIVGEKGATLSGGQKQRIAIARTLLMDKPIIIFDDSLSAVDTTTDKAIRKALEKGKKRTTIIITHRITTAKESDKIIVLDEGSVSAIGSHDYLVNNNELYSSLWNIQGALEDEFVKLVEKGEL